MAKETERKFRVIRIDSSDLGEGEQIHQGYLSFDPEIRVRVRDGQGYLTVKGEGTLTRDEYEFSIPVDDASSLLKLSHGYVIEKQRFRRGHWEIDVYKGSLTGLVIAELEGELSANTLQLPRGIEGYEVTEDSRYKNKNLAKTGSIEDLGPR